MNEVLTNILRLMGGPPVWTMHKLTPIEDQTETLEWAIRRLKCRNPICQVNEETYNYFRQVRPPVWKENSPSNPFPKFMYFSGNEPLWFFWRMGDDLFCRILTWDETDSFCQAACIRLTFSG